MIYGNRGQNIEIGRARFHHDNIITELKAINLGKDGANVRVFTYFDGDFVTFTPSIFTGTINHYDHGDYLFGEINGYTSSNVDSNRAFLEYRFPVKAGDNVSVVLSINAGQSFSDSMVYTTNSNNEFSQILHNGPSALDNATIATTVAVDGQFRIGPNIGSTAAIDRWFKIFSITINGDKKY